MPVIVVLVSTKESVSLIKIVNNEQFGLPGTKGRFIHIATFEYQMGFGVREFLYFHDRVTRKRYCEEVIGGHLEQIKDEDLIQEFERFTLEQGLAQLIIT